MEHAPPENEKKPKKPGLIARLSIAPPQQS